MQLEQVVTKLIKFIKARSEALALSVTCWCKTYKRRTKITKANRLENASFTFQDERKN